MPCSCDGMDADTVRRLTGELEREHIMRCRSQSLAHKLALLRGLCLLRGACGTRRARCARGWLLVARSPGSEGLNPYTDCRGAGPDHVLRLSLDDLEQISSDAGQTEAIKRHSARARRDTAYLGVVTAELDAAETQVVVSMAGHPLFCVAYSDWLERGREQGAKG